MYRTVDGQFIKWPIVESIIYRGKPRTIVEVTTIYKCGHHRQNIRNLKDAAASDMKVDNTMECHDCFYRRLEAQNKQVA